MIAEGTKTVSSAGTAERLSATDVYVFWLTIQADPSNTGNVYLGGDSVSSSSGIQLAPGDSHHFPPISRYYVYNLKNIWVDVGEDGEGVKYIAEQRY